MTGQSDVSLFDKRQLPSRPDEKNEKSAMSIAIEMDLNLRIIER